MGNEVEERVAMTDFKNKKITVYDVAKAAGVAPGTVSRTINNSGYVKEETRKKILKVVKQMQYIPNRTGIALKTTKTGLILLAIPDMSNGIFIGMIEAVNKLAKENNASMVLYYTEGKLEGELKAVRMLQENQVDGLFLINFSYSDQLHDELKRCTSPIILCGMCNSLWGNDEDNNFDTISIDVYNGIYDSTAHLIKQGHKKIGYLAGVKDLVVYQQRFNAFKQALKDYNISYNKEYVFWLNYYEENGYCAGREISLMDNRPTAICASNDLQAIGLWRACRDYGINVPEELSISGMDNLEMSSIINLTSMKMWEYEVGQAGASLLFKRLNNKCEQKSKNILFKPSLVIRESSLAK